jgi:hypothetical protein
MVCLQVNQNQSESKREIKRWQTKNSYYTVKTWEMQTAQRNLPVTMKEKF